jgi:hypothetical protein
MMFRRISKDQKCPNCRGSESYRIRREGLSVKVVCKILNLRPHYCPNCDLYFLGPRHRGMQKIRIPSPRTRNEGNAQHQTSGL